MPKRFRVSSPPQAHLVPDASRVERPSKHVEIDDDPASYGSKGQDWNASFIEYMKSIVTHPNYSGMPDAIKPDGKIQWEAPSNRGAGVYKDTHHRRRDWWRRKAAEIGIDSSRDEWISRTAKTIHPSGQKPCKRCGLVLRIAYAYPSALLVNRAKLVYGDSLAPEPTEEIGLYVQRVVDVLGVKALDKLPQLLSTGAITAPSLGPDVDAWLSWIEGILIPQEPSLLSPGAMSNAPDRFDGFHSFNRCCRSVADTGRHVKNMRTYTTDRRVFEYWSQGDWIAADRLMGIIRAVYRDRPCADGGAGPPSADHIGPLSLGFAHRPEFRLLSKAANSAKNNRMTLWDAEFLLKREAEGEVVASWYAGPLWDRIKNQIRDEETALRASKLLRDNQRNAMSMLAQLLASGQVAFLASLLELHYADYNVEFEGLEIVDNVTTYRRLVRTTRRTEYAAEQEARRVRIGFEALRAYSDKINRHRYLFSTPELMASLAEANRVLASAKAMKPFNRELAALLGLPATDKFEGKMRAIASSLPRQNAVPEFVEAQQHLQVYMERVAGLLAAMWDNERYVRAEFAFDD